MFDEIEESALGRLQASSYPPLRGVGCSFRDGTLTLVGCVPSYYQKQLAQSIVAEIEGVREIANRIRVSTASPRPPLGRDEGWRGATAG